MARRRRGSLLDRSGLTPDRARVLALSIGAMRVGIGAGFLALPVTSVRILGLDTATASRVTFLARMAAARDAALGAGTLWATGRGRGAAGWLLAGAACDLTDATVIALAARQRRLDPLRSAPAVASAVAAAALAGAAAATVGR